INYVSGIAIVSQDNLYFSEDQAKIRRIAPDGTISSIAADNNAAGLAVDAQDRLYVAEPSNGLVRMIAGNGAISTVAGTGMLGYAGEGGPALQAQLTLPS